MNADRASRASDWLFLAGVALSLVLVPLLVYAELVAAPSLFGGWKAVGVVALLPGVLMGGLGALASALG